LGRHAKPRDGLLRLAAKPTDFRPPSAPVGPAYYGPFCVHAQRSTTTLQRPLERPLVRGHRLPTTRGRCLETRKQLMQPPVVCPPGSRRKTGASTSRGFGHRALLAKLNVVPCFCPTGERKSALPGGPRVVLSPQARQGRRSPTSRVEHRGLLAFTPSWLYTRRGAIGRALRPDRLYSTVPRVPPMRT
jgi:hypothetical protein